tara:strand:+ start:58 stop:492 length:435 start_codon:yes stop_codon:yes gene_type:complete
MEITHKYHKIETIGKWRCRGLVYDDIDDLYYIYIKTMNCSHCGKEFPNTRDRCLDHCHETGLFRAIVCRRCNTHDSYLKYPNGGSRKEIDRKYKEDNIEKIKKRNNKKAKEKYTCCCGVTMSLSSRYAHKKTKKHTDWFMEQLD